MVHVIKIENLNASVRLRNVCRKAGIETVGELLSMTTEEKLSIKHFGVTTLIELHFILLNYSFFLLSSEEIDCFCPQINIDLEV